MLAVIYLHILNSFNHKEGKMHACLGFLIHYCVSYAKQFNLNKNLECKRGWLRCWRPETNYRWKAKFDLSPSVFHPDILPRGGKVEFWECEGGGMSFDQCIFFKYQGGGALRIQGRSNAPHPPKWNPGHTCSRELFTYVKKSLSVCICVYLWCSYDVCWCIVNV